MIYFQRANLTYRLSTLGDFFGRRGGPGGGVTIFFDFLDLQKHLFSEKKHLRINVRRFSLKKNHIFLVWKTQRC